MTGWLVYDEENIERNTRFIGFWLEEAHRRDISLSLVKTRDIAYGIRFGKPFVSAAGQTDHPEFAVMRAAHPLLSKIMEQQGSVFLTIRLSQRSAMIKERRIQL